MDSIKREIVAASSAKRELHREEMSRFGHELTWLANPDEIPESAIGDEAAVTEQCKNLAFWMLERLGAWSQRGLPRLHTREAFKKHRVSPYFRADVLRAFHTRPIAAYGPGVMAMAEVHAVIPSVGKNNGVDQAMWGSMARRASEFSDTYARGGTYAQMILRDYFTLSKGFTPDAVSSAFNSDLKEYNPARFKPDAETGITTVTAIDSLAPAAIAVVESFGLNEGPGRCVAIQAESPDPNCPNMYEAFWSSYASAAERLVYDRVDEAAIPLVPQEGVDVDYAAAIEKVFTIHRTYMARMSS